MSQHIGLSDAFWNMKNPNPLADRYWGPCLTVGEDTVSQEHFHLPEKERKNNRDSIRARRRRSEAKIARQSERAKIFRQAHKLNEGGHRIAAAHLMRQRDSIRPASKRDRDQRLH